MDFDAIDVSPYDHWIIYIIVSWDVCEIRIRYLWRVFILGQTKITK